MKGATHCPMTAPSAEAPAKTAGPEPSTPPRWPKRRPSATIGSTVNGAETIPVAPVRSASPTVS